MCGRMTEAIHVLADMYRKPRFLYILHRGQGPNGGSSCTTVGYLKVSRLSATKYLDTLAEDGILEKQKRGRSNYYINRALHAILTRDSMRRGSE